MPTLSPVVTRDRGISGPAPDTGGAGSTPNSQPSDADLSAVAALATTGLLVRTGSNLWALRVIEVPAALLGVTNPGGVAGDVTLTLPVRAANLVFAGPTTGGDAAPAFRALDAADIPAAIARDSEVAAAYVAQGGPLVNATSVSSLTFSNPPTQAECQALRDAVATILATLRVHS